MELQIPSIPHRELDRIFEVIIYEHKVRREAIKTSESQGDEDLVDVLPRVQENGELEFPFTTENIKSAIMDVFGAGTETSSATVEWAMSESLKNQRVMEKAQVGVRLLGLVYIAKVQVLKLLYASYPLQLLSTISGWNIMPGSSLRSPATLMMFSLSLWQKLGQGLFVGQVASFE